jgi:hypothetical protein
VKGLIISTPLSRLALASALAAAGLGLLVSSAAAAVKVELPQTGQGQIFEAGKIRVSVDPKKAGKAKVVVSSITDGDRVAVTKPTTAKVGKSGKTIGAKLTGPGGKRIASCVDQTLKAKVKVAPHRGRAQRGSTTAPLEGNLATCSVGSEDPTERPYYGPNIPTPNAAACDFLDTAVCLQPWPNDYYTAADGSTATGRRVNMALDATPERFDGVHIDPTDFNRADGFSPGHAISVKVPGLDSQAAFDETAPVPITDLAAFDDADQPVVVINAESGERHPIWVELDEVASTDELRNLIIRPAVNFEEGERYIVALRNLVDASGDDLDPPLGFRAYRDRLITTKQVIEDRRPEVEGLIAELQDAGIPRATLHLAWDFTVASEQSISGRVLAMRDDAFERLGDEDLADLTVQGVSPDFEVTETTDFTPAENEFLMRRVRGTIDVPCYLNADGCPPGSQFAYENASDTTPEFDPDFEATVPFTCVIPRSVSDGEEITPARPSLYGHGLLGTRAEVESGSGQNIRMMANEHNFVFCAVDWAGMSTPDLNPVVYPILFDVSNFPKLADRVQQGFINFMYLGRALIHEDGLSSDPAFQVDPDDDGPEDAEPVINTDHLFYDGNSQGGIMGGALTALSPDFQRASLGVPAMNYSTLLQRSVDFDPFAEQLYNTYRDELERPVLISLMQMLWDRGEANGYAQHMTSDPLPETPPHEVLMHAAFGDHQVANVAAEVEARTIGASILTPALDPGRHWEESPFMGIPAIGSFPFTGSALVYWDGGPVGFTGTIGGGSGTPPNGNLPPRTEDGYGIDPHSYPRRDVQARQQKSDFLQLGGAILSGCANDAPCYSNGWTGPPGP